MKNILLSHKGVSIIESIASVIIITIIISSAFTILISSRNQTIATQEELVAIEAANKVREQINNDAIYLDVLTWVNGETKVVSSITTRSNEIPFSLDNLQYINQNLTYDKEIIVTFYPQTASDQTYQVVKYVVSINYYATRTVEIEGFLYES